MNKKFRHWLEGDYDVMAHVSDTDERPYTSRREMKRELREMRKSVNESQIGEKLILAERKSFYMLYNVVAVLSCIFLIGVLLFTIARLPRYGKENPETTEVVERYVEKGVEETGAVNIVSGMILDYRAFDTLGESHVLFTALICVMILLMKDKKNMGSIYEDYYRIRTDRYHDISKDSIMRLVGMILIPCIFMYGVYVLLNGQNSPGGGFSGGAVMGAGLIIFAAAYGFASVDRIFTRKVISVISFISLAFYSFAKCYVFFMGANGLENHIPKGTPGAILSGGMILPLDIAVGMVVTCTMYGFYSLFKRGSIGSD